MEGTHFAVTEIPTAKYNDKYSSIYVAFVLCGIGFLLPYNTFVTAVDYYQAKHPATTIVYDVSMTYICVACVTVIVNNMLVGTVPLQTRITAGYMLSIATMALVTICDIGLELFSENISYRITLVSVAAVSVASTVQQSSFYGFASMLPSRYTQALMLGESTAGVFTSLNRVITKSLVSDLSASILVFFSFCLAAIVACCVVFQIIRQAEFVELHIGLCTADSGSGGQGGGGGLAGLHHHAQTESAAAPALGGDGERPAEEVDMLEKSWSSSRSKEAGKTRHISNGTLSYHGDIYGSRRYLTESDDVIDFNDVTVLQRQPSSSRRNTLCTKLAASISRRLDVTRRVWPYMLSITLAYLVTLMLYPGVVTEVTSCRFGSWMPVILIIAFNVSDFVGKLLAANRHEMRRHQLVALGLARFVLVPLLVLCTLPRASPRLSEEVWPIVFSIMLGVTNGYLGSVPIILAPKYVPNQYKELTGNMMTLFYNFGLTVGSALAYAIESKLGPHAELSIICAQQAASISNIDNSDLQHSTTMRF